MNSATWGLLPSACTLATTGSAGPDRITKTTYDNVNRPILVQSAYGTADQTDEASGYTDNGKTATLTDGENNKTTYEYDSLDRLVKTRYPDTTAGAGTSSTTDYEQLVYDANGNVTSRRLRGYAADTTQHIDYGYDNLNRMTSKDVPDANSDVGYAYDLLGRTTSVTIPGQGITHSMAYDALGRLTSETQPLGSMSYQYDLAGNRTVQLWNDGFYVTYDHLVTGEVTAIRENGAASGVGVLATYGYDDIGRRTGIVRGNGTTTSFGYDTVSRLTSLGQDLAGTSYDLGLGLSYNPASQISGVTRSNDVYAYTANTNFDRSYINNGLNQVTAVAGGSVGYDARGNLTSTGANTFTYTSENMLKAMTGVATLSYDGFGRLLNYDSPVGESARFLYDGSHMAAEIAMASTAITRRYVFGPGADEPIVWYEGSGTTDRRWLHADERGSIIAVTNSSGTAIAVNSYDEYGVPANGNSGRFQYTGQAFFKERGLYYYKARFYAPRIGRFMQADPIGYGAGMNLNSYVGGDPINFNDPSGSDRQPGEGDQYVPSCPTNDFFCYDTTNIYGPTFGVPDILVFGARQSSPWSVGATLDSLFGLTNIFNSSESSQSNDIIVTAPKSAPASCGLAIFGASVDGRIGGIGYDTPGEKRALNDFMHGRTRTMRLGQGYLNRITAFYAKYPRQVVALPSQAGDPAGSFRARVTFANYSNSSINDPYLDGLIGQGTVLFDSASNAIGLWDNFDFNAGNRGFAIEAGLADIRFGRSTFCGTSGSFPIRAGVAQ